MLSMELRNGWNFEAESQSEAVTECRLEVGSLAMMGETSDKRLLISNVASMFVMGLSAVDSRTGTNNACVQSSYFF